MCRKGRKTYNWEPANPKMLPKPENCPNAIFEFYNKSKSNSVCSIELRSNVRKHLLFSNWSIEYKPQENCSNKFRYVSPDRQHTYYSLIHCCNYLVESETGASSPLIEQPLVSVGLKESPMETLPLIPHPLIETLPFSSLLSEETLPFSSLLSEQSLLFEGSRELPIETLFPAHQDGQTCNVLPAEIIEQPRVQEDSSEALMETLCPIPQVTQTSVAASPLLSSLLIEPGVYDYLKKWPAGPLYSSQEDVQQPRVNECFGESPVQIPSPIPQDGQKSLAVVPFGPLIDQKSKSRKPLARYSADDIDPEYCPQAVVEYVNLGPSIAQKQKDNDKLKDLRRKVMNHLCYVGWEIYYINKSNKKERLERRYLSPSGKRYISLITACEGYLGEQGKFDQIPPASNASKQAEKLSSQKRSTPHHDSSYLAVTYPMADDSSGGDFSTRVTKRARLSPPPSPVEAAVGVAPPPSRHNSRNLLARLIDNNEISVGAEVQYRGRDNRPMAEGHITRDGINCNCCQEVFNLSNFEAHAGSTNHRPAANIFLKDGRSLQECHLLLKPEEGRSQLILKRDNNHVKSNRKNNKLKGNQDHRLNGYQCSVCHKWGALVSCYQCPSSFHTSCLSLQEVPNGDWFCKSCEDQPTNEAESCPQAIVDYLLLSNILTRMDDNNKKLIDLRSKAKRHLCSIGWSFFHANKGSKRELQYKSPSGRVYVSLIAACEGCIFDDGSQLK